MQCSPVFGSRLLVAVAAVALLLGGCKNPFATREAEPPVQTRSRWVPPYQPADVLENLRNALSDEHVLNYVRCLSDSALTGRTFRFDPEPSVAAQYPDLFAAWDREHERRYLDQLFQAVPNDSLLRLDFRLVSEQVGEGEERLLVTEYTLEAHHGLSPELAPRRVEGRAEFWLVREEKTSYWYIWRWSDRATGDAPTWSALKAAFGR